MVWEPKFCCCCASPRTGTLILGWLGIISAVGGTLGGIRSLFMSRHDIIQMCNFKGRLVDDSTCYSSFFGGGIVGILMEVVLGAICVMLILGVNRRNSCLMIPYLLYLGFVIIVTGILFLVLIILMGMLQAWIGVIIFLLIGGGITFLQVHFLLVVRVCFKEVKQQPNPNEGDIEVGYIQRQEPPNAPPAYKF